MCLKFQFQIKILLKYIVVMKGFAPTECAKYCLLHFFLDLRQSVSQRGKNETSYDPVWHQNYYVHQSMVNFRLAQNLTKLYVIKVSQIKVKNDLYNLKPIKNNLGSSENHYAKVGHSEPIRSPNLVRLFTKTQS